MAKRITMVGSANVDFIMGLPHLPHRGESVVADTYTQTFGGKGSNQAIASLRSGGEVSLVVSIGGDALGSQLLDNYKKDGFDVSNIAVHQDMPCGTALILYDPQGDNMLGVTMGANARLSPEQVLKAEAVIADSAIIMMQMEVPDEPMIKTLELAKKHGVEVMLNYAPYRKSTVNLADVGIFVVNETEAGALLGMDIDGEESARVAVKKLAEQNGHRLAIVTLGANGSIIWENNEVLHVPSFKVVAKDATAAGDSYCGALATALCEGKTIREAAVFASAAGAICASRVGAQPSIPNRAEIDAFLNERK